MLYDTNEREVSLEGEGLERFLLSLANQVISGQPGIKPTTARLFGEAALTGGRLLIKGAPVQVAAGSMASVLGIPAEAGLKPASSLLNRIKGVRLTLLDGSRARVRVPTSEEFSLLKDDMERSELISDCIGHFFARNYLSCAAAATSALLTHAHSMLHQLQVISLQRLSRSQQAEAEGRRALAALTYTPWHQALMRITLGTVVASELYRSAADETRLAQLKFYEGARAVTLEKFADAVAPLTACSRCTADLMEFPLARVELEHVLPGAKPRV